MTEGANAVVARWRLDIAYDGTNFHGWARQPGLRTVEHTVSQALATVLHADAPIDVVCAGRTDAGVHARGQVVHADLPAGGLSADDAPTLLRRLEGVLPEDVAVRNAQVVTGDFDARFSALSREYAYRIADSHSSRDPLRNVDVVTHPRFLDLDRMNGAAQPLIGEHDFAAFCRSEPNASTVRKVLECAWQRDGEGRAVLTIRADAFCHSMVRAVTGALVAVGDGRRDPEWVAEVLQGRQRDPGASVMPARGLTLEAVEYPAQEQWAGRQLVTRSVREDPVGGVDDHTGN